MNVNMRIAAIDKKMNDLYHQRKQLEKDRAALTKGQIFCDNCGKYFDPNFAEQTSKKKTGVECVYCDAGYRDDDELADVTRVYLYRICPFCGTPHETLNHVISEVNRRRRR